MKFQRESYSPNLVAEMIPMLSAHDKEVPQLGMVMEPDFMAYKRLAESGCLRIFTARIGSILVGYQVYFMSYHPHRKGSLEATRDVLYLDPEVRHGLVGMKFIRFCDKELEKENVKVIHQPIAAEKDFGRVLERMGYKLTDLVYSRKVA